MHCTTHIFISNDIYWFIPWSQFQFNKSLSYNSGLCAGELWEMRAATTITSHSTSAHLQPWSFPALTVACARSRSHHRWQTSDSRNTRCTFWPEIRRCRRTGELLRRRWSALSPPWQSRLPGLIASEGDLAKRSGLPQRKTRFLSSKKQKEKRKRKRKNVMCSCANATLTYSGASRRCGAGVCFVLSAHAEQRLRAKWQLPHQLFK